MPRKGENIRKRRDGRWEGRFPVDTPDHGRKMCSVYARSYREVREKLYRAREKEQFRQQCLPQKRQTQQKTVVLVSHTAEEWLAEIATTKKHATYVKYRTVYQKYLRDPLQNLSLTEVAPDFLKTAIFSKASLSSSLKRSIISVLQQILRYGATHSDTALPVLQTEKTTNAAASIAVFSRLEQEQLFQSLYREMNLEKLGILLCLSTGLRLGELCALRWEDFDFQAGTLRVQRSVQRIWVGGQEAKTRLVEDSPKTVCSRREIPVAEELLVLLERFRRPGVYVFGKSRPLEPRTCQNRFRRYLEKAGIAYRNFHVLRHTFATNCIEQGMDVKCLSELLGHSDVRITLNRYVHTSLAHKRRQLQALCTVYGQYQGQSV